MKTKKQIAQCIEGLNEDNTYHTGWVDALNWVLDAKEKKK